MATSAVLFIDCRPVADDPGGATVTVHGPLLLRSAAELRRVLTVALDTGVRRLDVDLGGVTDVDPAGLAALVVAARRLQAHADDSRLRFTAISAECEAVMRRLHLFTEHLAAAGV